MHKHLATLALAFALVSAHAAPDAATVTPAATVPAILTAPVVTPNESFQLAAFDLKDATTYQATEAKIAALTAAANAEQDPVKSAALAAQATDLQTKIDTARKAAMAANPAIGMIRARVAYDQEVALANAKAQKGAPQAKAATKPADKAVPPAK